MTVTAFVSRSTEPWTVDDLDELPDDGYRYEIADGSLLVSPTPMIPHVDINDRLGDLLKRQAPDGFRVLAVGAGMAVDRTNYFIPDVVVVPQEAVDRGGKNFASTDVLLAIEVISPGNASKDLVLKRHHYAKAGVPQYWLADPRSRTLTVLTIDGSGEYEEHAIVQPGKTWSIEIPFNLSFDPAEIFP